VPNRPYRHRRAETPNPRWSRKKTSIASNLSKCAGDATTGTGIGTGVTGAGADTAGTDATGTGVTGIAVTGEPLVGSIVVFA
jgi:hypothetical protein